MLRVMNFDISERPCVMKLVISGRPCVWRSWSVLQVTQQTPTTKSYLSEQRLWGTVCCYGGRHSSCPPLS
jgi:hypothetical protein